MPNVFSVDVEDWFHLLDNEQAPSAASWGSMESRVRHNTELLVRTLSDHEVRGTFFVLGWVAEQSPGLVADIAAAGHEIASHGYAHTLIYTQKRDEFRDDLRRANEAIFRAAGVRPKGYRAPGFSIKRRNLWAFDVLAEEGFDYDSSVFPALRAHGGLPGTAPLPTVLENGLVEFPISTANLGIMRWSYLGGGYLRLLPKSLVLACARSQARDGIPLILYLHPRDIDPGQPRMKLAPHTYFRTYVGLKGCLNKVSALLDRFSWTSFEGYLRTSRPKARGSPAAAA